MKLKKTNIINEKVEEDTIFPHKFFKKLNNTRTNGCIYIKKIMMRVVIMIIIRILVTIKNHNF